MKEQPTKEFIEQTRPGEERSLYADMIRSRDFGEKALWSDAQLREIGNYWTDQQVNPERSLRALEEIKLLISRTVFEMLQRQNDLINESMEDIDSFSFGETTS